MIRTQVQLTGEQTSMAELIRRWVSIVDAVSFERLP